jgi:hypothetical protein|tara:strand:+ start:330 stop:1067 length:738 start_codon:yes stop_codon:yes gene_type:complete
MLQVSNLKIKLSDKVITKKWLDLHRGLKVDPDSIIDNNSISDDIFAKDIQEANKNFGFSWDSNPTTQDAYNKMHKDIETAPKDKADVLQKIHDHLHIKEAGNNKASQIQVVWSESLGQFYKKQSIDCDMPKNAEPFDKKIAYGDVYLGYPHIGKSPETCMLQNDKTNLKQTCRIHDKIVCDILISLVELTCKSDEKLLDWYDDNKITMFSKEEMLKYNGWAKIGEVINKEQIDKIDRNNLKIQYE